VWTDYWIVGVNSETLIVHRSPLAGMYRQIQTLAKVASVNPLSLPAVTVPVTVNVADLLG